jgi:hypothetical protein
MAFGNGQIDLLRETIQFDQGIEVGVFDADLPQSVAKGFVDDINIGIEFGEVPQFPVRFFSSFRQKILGQ